MYLYDLPLSTQYNSIDSVAYVGNGRDGGGLL